MIPEESASDNERPPPLPPRPAQKPDPKDLQAQATTAVSSIDIQTLSFPDGSRGTFSTPGPADTRSSSGITSPNIGFTPVGLEAEDSISVMSLAPTTRPPGDIASLLGGPGGGPVSVLSRKSQAWSLLRSQSAGVPPFEGGEEAVAKLGRAASGILADFASEFDELPDASAVDFTDEDRLRLWRAKLKHYLILSSAGKPIYSRHGDQDLVNSYMGVVQTIISFYEATANPLQGFTAGAARFVVAVEGPLYLVAISRLGESDAQLRDQLRALYMQILSTLTLPALTNMFANRPSTDLRRPLQGTEPLLSSLADSFTRGSPSALLGSLECLRLRKSQRHAINNAFLRQRCDKLLYGLIVAGGRLVSVIRPRRHSLHPSDLQLVFNMLFESGGVRAGGGESWIPLCLPAFNNRGYLYMYVSFFDGGVDGEPAAPAEESSNNNSSKPAPSNPDEEIAIILISPDKESFFELKQMRDNVARQLAKAGHLALIRAAARAGRPHVADVAPGSPVAHFLYKSRANVQFAMASLAPAFASPLARRRLVSLYHRLHAAAHARHAHLRVLHEVAVDASALAWITPVFEFYCVAGPNVSQAAVTQGANKVIQWARREEERLFIIGGGVW